MSELSCAKVDLNRSRHKTCIIRRHRPLRIQSNLHVLPKKGNQVWYLFPTTFMRVTTVIKRPPSAGSTETTTLILDFHCASVFWYFATPFPGSSQFYIHSGLRRIFSKSVSRRSKRLVCVFFSEQFNMR